MNFENFGDVRIFRPSFRIEDAIRTRARTHLLSRFAPGNYRGAQAANAVIQHQFKFYEGLLGPLIPKLATRDAAEFLLFQFDQAARILHCNGILDLKERERWKWIEPIFKRAIKYLVEMICISSNRQQATIEPEHAASTMETALSCAENMAYLAQESELVHSIFPEDGIVKIFDRESLDYTIRIEGKYERFSSIFLDRVIRDRQSRDQYVGFPQFDNETAKHQIYLDKAFTQSFGITYGEFIAAIIAIVNDSSPSLHPNSFPTLFIRRDSVIDELAKSGRPRGAIERAIDGFSISSSNLLKEGRVMWNPKQENRAYRRGFYVFPHETGPHLAFSRAMARENLIQLVNSVPYKRLPLEWKTPTTCSALEYLSRGASRWFEEVVRRNLARLGINGHRVDKVIGEGTHRLRIPELVGEIDFLGYQSETKLLVIAEAKMTMTGLEARYWKDDLNEFVFRRSSYAEKFRRKLNWVRDNRDHIANAMGCGPIRGIGAAMLTLYPCVAREFIQDFPCVSVTEFMLDYGRQDAWPYNIM